MRHTVIGYNQTTFEAFVRVTEGGPHWITAMQRAVEARDERPAAVFEGVFEAAGTMENLPNRRSGRFPFSFSDSDMPPSGEAAEYTVVGFDEYTKDAVIQQHCPGRSWVKAVWSAIDGLGTAASGVHIAGSYRFIAAFKGNVAAVGTWGAFRAALNESLQHEEKGGARMRAAN